MTDEKLIRLEQSLQEHMENMTSADWHAWYENQHKEEKFERAHMELKMKMRLFKIQLKKEIAKHASNLLFASPHITTDNRPNVSFTLSTTNNSDASNKGKTNYKLAA